MPRTYRTPAKRRRRAIARRHSFFRSFPDMRPYLILLPLLAACAPRPRTDPAKVAEAFHAALFGAPIVGAPMQDDMQRLHGFLSDTLARLLERAGRIRDSE